MSANDKIKSRDELTALRKRLMEQKKTVVFTNGCFDILHRGHVEYLERASEFGDVLIVGVNSDASTRRLKGKGRPLTPQQDRAYILASLASVDYVTIFDEDTPLDLIKSLRPDVLLKGGDYQLNQIVGRDVVEGYGGKVLTVPLIPNRSTTSVMSRLAELTEKEKPSG